MRYKPTPRTKQQWLDAITHDRTSASGKPYGYHLIKSEYVKSTDRITIVCPEHGPFEVYAFSHLKYKGCTKCGALRAGAKKKGQPSHRKLTLEQALEKAKVKFPDLDYSQVKEYDPKGRWNLVCPKHGSYQHKVFQILWDETRGCPGCKKENNRKTAIARVENSRDAFDNTAEFYGYEVLRFTGAHNPVKLRCPEHGPFTLSKAYYLTQNFSICPCCRKGSSTPETILKKFLEKNLKKVHFHRRDILKGGKELDIYLPEYKVAIEVNGIYFHSDTGKNKNYHLQKTEESSELGICLLHFTDTEILTRTRLVVSMILAKCGIFRKRVGARQTIVKNIDSKLARRFLDANHIQGFVAGASYLGLFSKKNESLGAVAVFGKPRFAKDADWELLRFSSRQGLQIQGGLSKMISAFAQNHTGKLISYADRSYSYGNVYEAAGFTLVRKTSPSYSWFSTKQVLSRFQTQKSQLHKLLEGYDSSLSEDENMRAHGFRKLHNSGNLVYKISLRKFR
jgi:very-short-patch-repair endonuclease